MADPNMPTPARFTGNPQDRAAVQQYLDSDPEIQAAFRQIEAMRAAGVPLVQAARTAQRTGQPSVMAWAQQNLQPLLLERGLEPIHDWGISLGQNGDRVGQLQRKGFWDRNSDWIAPAIVAGAGIVGGAGAAGAFGGGSGGSGVSGVLPSTAQSFQGVGFAPTVSPGLGTTAPSLTGVLPSTAPVFNGTGFAPTVTPSPSGISPVGGNVASPGSSGDSILGKFEKFSKSPTGQAVGFGLSQLGRLGEGQADERGDENRYGADLNRALASLFATEQGASSQATDAEERGKLDRAKLGLDAPNIRTRQSILGSLLQEMQPFEVGDTGRIKVPKISGGLTPAALNPAARETGSILQKQAIDALLSGSDIPEPTDFQAARLPAPDLNQYQGPGTGESILSGLGAAGNTFAGVMETLRKQSQGTPSKTFTQSPELGYMGG